MMQETKGYKLIEGFRGKSGDIDSVVDTIVKISRFIYENNSSFNLWCKIRTVA